MNTDVIASSTGMPAAMNAPNATSRIRNVIGRLIDSADARSSPTLSLMPASSDASPACSTSRAGLAFWTLAVASIKASTWSAASSTSPDIVIGTSNASRFSDQMGGPTSETPLTSVAALETCVAAASALAESSEPLGVVMSTDSVGLAARPASSIMAAARPDSPTRKSSSETCLVWTVDMSAIAATTKATQRPMARQG